MTLLDSFLAWIKSETELATADTWAPPAYAPCSSEDPRCAELIARQQECRERMRRMKAGLLDGRTFTNSASTDVAATVQKARAMSYGPVRLARKVR